MLGQSRFSLELVNGETFYSALVSMIVLIFFNITTTMTLLYSL